MLLDGVGFGVVYASAWLISSGGSTAKFVHFEVSGSEPGSKMS